MSRRRFINLVLDTYDINRRYAYGVHRIDASSLFHPRKPKGEAAAGAAKDGDNDIPSAEDARQLPAPAVTFYPSPIYGECMSLGGRNPDDMVAMDQDGRGVLYRIASRSFDILPTLHGRGPIYEPISLAVGGRFYMMNSSHAVTPPLEESHFDALVYGRCPDTFDLPEVWYWRSLPTPPFFSTRPSEDRRRNGRWSYDEVYYEGLADEDARPRVTAYTAVNDAEIWASFGGATYSFDTVRGDWRKLGDWAMPFEGRAEYSAEHEAWFGLSPSNARLLCASDLLESRRRGGTSSPPRLRDVWEELAMPEEWYLCSSCLLPLGSGRFCVAKVFETGRGLSHEYDERFLLLTGVEVERRCGAKGGRGGRTEELRLVKHRTCRYNLSAVTYIRVF